jgi:hypothetical protein
MHEYRDFKLGYEYPKKQSFWLPVQELYKRLNPRGGQYGFIAINASKVDQHGSTPGPEVRIASLKTGILSEEIRILDPHIVVFFTGPAYEPWLDGWFPGLVRNGDMLKATLTAPDLKCPSFRTYHPRALNYRSKRKEVFDWIVEQLSA